MLPKIPHGYVCDTRMHIQRHSLCSILSWFDFSSALVISLGIITGCDSTLDREEYVQWVRDYENGLHTRSSHSGFVFDLQYQPSEYVLLQRHVDSMPEAVRAEELKKLSAIQYYTLILSAADKTDILSSGLHSAAERQSREYHLSYRFQDDITLEENGKVLPCVLFHFEKPVVRDGGRTFVLGFENSGSVSGSAAVVIRSALFGGTPIKINVVKSNIPQVVL